MGGLRALPYFLKSASKATGKPAPDAHNLLLTSLFQAGVDEFVIDNYNLRNLTGLVMPNFLSERFVPVNDSIWDEKWNTLHDTFEQYAPDGYQTSEGFAPVVVAESFLADLLYALEERVRIVTMLEPPDELDLKDLLPDELLLPTTNLLASFEDENVEVTIPRTTVSAENVERYEEILDSDLFSRYNGAQPRTPPPDRAHAPHDPRGESRAHVFVQVADLPPREVGL